MIQSKADYKDYLKADRVANKINLKTALISPQWQFLKRLRYCEYITNCVSKRYGFLGGGD